MASPIGSLRVHLGLDSAQFSRGLNEAQGRLKRVGSRMQSIGTGMTAGITAPLAGFGALTLKTAGDFEASMNRVRSGLAGLQTPNIGELSEKARQLGSDTSFSATEAANAIEVLAKNGVAAADIMGGALDASLSLAASSGSDLASTADVATDVMANFGKTAAEMGGVVDGVTGVLLQSKFGFDDYRLAIGQAGGVAGALGVELEDFNAVIAATSSSFASGSDAGTSFKTFLQRLVPASEPAAEAMSARVGVLRRPGQHEGHGRGRGGVAEGVAGLNDEARNDALSTIFGQDAIRTALPSRVKARRGLTNSRRPIDQASATEQAEARLQGLNGTLKQLSSAFQELQLVIADSGILDAFTKLVEGATSIIRALGDADPRLVQFGVTAGILAAALGPVVAAVGLVVAAVGGAGIGLVAVVIAATAAFVAFRDELAPITDAVIKFGKDAIEYIANLAPEITAAFRELPAQMLEIGGQIMDGLRRGIANKISSVRESISNVASDMLSSMKGALGIQSPSKEMRKIGEFAMEGLDKGLKVGKGKVTSEVKGAAEEKSRPSSKTRWSIWKTRAYSARSGARSTAFLTVSGAAAVRGKGMGDALESAFTRVAESLASSGINDLLTRMVSNIGFLGGGRSSSPGRLRVVR